MKRKKIIVVILMTLIISICTIANAKSTETTELSKKYEEWLSLPEEEREKTIAPLPFNVRGGDNDGILRIVKSLQASSLPKKYDLREHIDVEVKNQMNTGSCWAFSATSAAETTLAQTQSENLNFSERHMEYNTSNSFLEGQNNPWALNRKVGNGRIFYYGIYILFERNRTYIRRRYAF